MTVLGLFGENYKAEVTRMRLRGETGLLETSTIQSESKDGNPILHN